MPPLPWMGAKPVLQKVQRPKQYTTRVTNEMSQEIQALQELWGIPINDVLNVVLVYGLDSLRNMRDGGPG